MSKSSKQPRQNTVTVGTSWGVVGVVILTLSNLPTFGFGESCGNPNVIPLDRDDMTHYLFINDTRTGDLLDLIPFCSDSCHQDYCRTNQTAYEGWNGAHETYDDAECATCEALLQGTSELHRGVPFPRP